MIESYTNSSLASARRCLREFDLRYQKQLDLDAEDSEALQVGQTWHKAFEEMNRNPENPNSMDAGYAALALYAPSPLWNEKLRRLFAAHAWYWRSQPLNIVEPERQFAVHIGNHLFRGQIDGIVEHDDGRLGILERKTTGFDLDEGSSYWTKLRLDVQVGLYARACGFDPAFIIYDVVRKPTIAQKAISQKDAARLRAELDKGGSATYFESFGPEVIEAGLAEGRETIEMYGARLTSDIGDRPTHYFARREVTRTRGDYDCLEKDLLAQVAVIEFAQANDAMHRNPDACNTFGLCAFFGLCSNNVMPTGSDVPNGFRRRDALHPELVA